MEDASFVPETVLSSGQLTEVAGGFWDNVIVKLEDDSSGGFGIYCDVKLKEGLVTTREDKARHDATYEYSRPTFVNTVSFACH